MSGHQCNDYNQRIPWPSVKRRLPALVLTIALSAFLGLPAGLLAQNQPLPEGVDKTLTTKDNWPIAITYYESKLGKESPVVILLHMRKSNRLVWKGGFAKQLQAAGYAVVAVDLRKHGESKPKNVKKSSLKLRSNDYKAMVALDLEAVKKFLMEEHHNKKLNIRKTAIIAAEMSAPIALNFAWIDWLKKPYPDAPTLPARTPRGQDIRAIVLLSPEVNLPGVTSSPPLVGRGGLPGLRNPNWEVAFMIGYGTNDTLGKNGRDATSIHKKLLTISENKPRVFLQGYKTKLRGTDMLGSRLRVEAHILGFLRKFLKELEGEWTNRKSRLE